MIINLLLNTDYCLVFATHFESELSANSADQQSASDEGSEGNGADKKLVDYKVGEEVNCFVKSVRLIAFPWVFFKFRCSGDNGSVSFIKVDWSPVI